MLKIVFGLVRDNYYSIFKAEPDENWARSLKVA